jgi:hypothetical protein
MDMLNSGLIFDLVVLLIVIVMALAMRNSKGEQEQPPIDERIALRLEEIRRNKEHTETLREVYVQSSAVQKQAIDVLADVLKHIATKTATPLDDSMLAVIRTAQGEQDELKGMLKDMEHAEDGVSVPELNKPS